MDVSKQKLDWQKALVALIGVLFAFSPHYFQYNSAGGGLKNPFNNAVWIVFSLLLIPFVGLVSQRAECYISPLVKRVAIGLLILIVPVVAVTIYHSGEMGFLLAGIAFGLLFYLVLLQLDFNLRQSTFILMCILMGCYIEVFWSIYQFFEIVSLAESVIYDRPSGVFQQPNVLGSYLATGLAVSAILFVQAEKNKIIVLSALLFPLLCVAIIMLLQSRSTYISIVVVSLLASAALWRHSPKSAFSWFVSVIVGVCFGFIMLSMFDSSVRDLAGMTRVSNRTEIYMAALHMIMDNPLGLGVGNMERLYPEYYAENWGRWTSSPIFLERLSHVHNELLQWVIEGGIITLFGFAFLAAIMFLGILKLSRTRALLVSALLFPIVFHSLVEFPLYYSAIHWLLLIFSVFYLDKASGATVGKVPLKARALMLGIPIMILVIVFLVTNLFTINLLYKYESTGARNTELLNSSVNEVGWGYKFGFYRGVSSLKAGLVEGDTKKIVSFIKWAEGDGMRHPTGLQYHLLSKSYRALGDNERADKWISEGVRLFPNNAYLKTDIQ